MTPDYWSEAKSHLAKKDKVLRKLIRTYPDASLRTRGDAFQTLARSIVGQQISVKAAQSIWDRFAACAVKVTPANVVVLEDTALRACGLSGSKAAYIKDLAGHFHAGLLKPRRWTRMDDEKVIEDLVRVKGIGRWSAEMFLMFFLGRPDVLPVDDYSLRKAYAKAFNKRKLPTPQALEKVGEKWRPYRTVASWYLWSTLNTK
jgi:DNA-3-methyladenine glycosylase II